MPDDTRESLNRVAKSLEKVAILLRQASEERQSLAKAISGRPGKFDQEAHNQKMDALHKESERKYLEQQEYRATVLKLLKEQAESLKRIESHFRSNT
jgi:hypothetical protein